MKIHTLRSPSHDVLFDRFFKPSVEEFLSADLVDHVYSQDICPSGRFDGVGFNAFTSEIVTVVLKALMEDDGEDFFIYSDCDILFFKDCVPDLRRRMKGMDLLVQRDGNLLCSGFMAVRKNKIMEDILHATAEGMVRNPSMNDQQIMQGVVYNNPCRMDMLDAGCGYGNLSHTTSCGLYNTGDRWTLPKDQYLWHANFTIGVPNKVSMLEEASQQHERMGKNE